MSDRYDLRALDATPSLLDGLPRREYDDAQLRSFREWMAGHEEPADYYETCEGLSIPVQWQDRPRPRPLGLRRQVRSAAMDGLCGLLWLAVGILAGYGLAWWRGAF